MIRLSKTGRRGEKKYRIVVKEKRSKRDAKSIDTLGYFEITPSKQIVKKIDQTKFKEWVRRGAKASPAVNKII